MFFISFILLFVAICIYISNRSSDMLIYSFLGIDTNNYLFQYMRRFYCSISWVKYNLPDGLWLLSYLLLMESIWGMQKGIKLIFDIPIIVFAFLMELFQYIGVFPGTGDILDLLFYMLSILTTICITKIINYYETFN